MLSRDEATMRAWLANQAEAAVACTLGDDDLAAQAERWRKLRAAAEVDRRAIGDPTEERAANGVAS
jgi:hypothetical protein